MLGTTCGSANRPEEVVPSLSWIRGTVPVCPRAFAGGYQVMAVRPVPGEERGAATIYVFCRDLGKCQELDRTNTRNDRFAKITTGALEGIIKWNRPIASQETTKK